MTLRDVPSESWVPDACTLPTADQPLRVAEFDALFATGRASGERLAPTHLRLILDPASRAHVQDLVDRETACCSFFHFEVAATGTTVTIDVEVPPDHAPALDAVARRALGPLSRRA